MRIAARLRAVLGVIADVPKAKSFEATTMSSG
jgi:hypothetical protein